MLGGILKLAARAPKIALRHVSVAVLMLTLTLSPRYAIAQECQQCQGGKGEGGGGGKASDVLFGLAAIMAAAAPMVAAAIQADADKQIAQTNANAQMAMTQMSADTSKYMADQQKEIAMGQAQIAADISMKNQQSSTERLEMQLAELNVAREQAAALEDKKFQYQQQLDAERVALAKAQSEEATALAAKQMRAQLTAAGMSQGFASSTNSAAGVPVTPAGSTSIPNAGSTGASSYAVAANSATKVSTGVSAPGSTTAKATSATSATSLSSVPLKSTNLASSSTKKSSTSRGISSQSSSTKLVSSSSVPEAATTTVAASADLQASLTKNSLARGSTSAQKQNGKSKSTDLDSFTKTVAQTTPSKTPQRGISSVSEASLEPATSWAPTYNPPSLTGSGHRR